MALVLENDGNQQVTRSPTGLSDQSFSIDTGSMKPFGLHIKADQLIVLKEVPVRIAFINKVYVHIYKCSKQSDL